MTVVNDKSTDGSTKRAAGQTGPPMPTAAARQVSTDEHADRAAPAQAIVQFLSNWVLKTSGEIYPGARLLIEYDPARLAPVASTGEEAGPWELDRKSVV